MPASISASSALVGISILRLLDILSYLATVGFAQTDDMGDFAALYQHHTIEAIAYQPITDLAKFAIVATRVRLHHDRIPVETFRVFERYAMLAQVLLVLGWVEGDLQRIYCNYE